MLLLHKKVEFVQAILPCTILFVIIFKRFEKPDYRDTAFMLNAVSHLESLCAIITFLPYKRLNGDYKGRNQLMPPLGRQLLQAINLISIRFEREYKFSFICGDSGYFAPLILLKMSKVGSPLPAIEHGCGSGSRKCKCACNRRC